jgi:threonine dehydratase
MLHLDEFLNVNQAIAVHINHQQLQNFPALDQYIGNGINIFFKPENLQRTGSFKIRNAFAALVFLSEDEKKTGVVAASTGNLGQALAYAGKTLGVPVTICVKENNHPEKNKQITAAGAKLVAQGPGFDEALQIAMSISGQTGKKLIRSCTDVHALSGAATLGWEIFNDPARLDVLFVSVASGAHAYGAAFARRAAGATAKIIGVQSDQAPGVHDSWHAKKAVPVPAGHTIADGIAVGGEYCQPTLQLLDSQLDDFITVSDDAIWAAMKLIYRYTGHIAEPAGAAGLAGLLSYRTSWRNCRVGIVISGGNIQQELLRKLQSAYELA